MSDRETSSKPSTDPATTASPTADTTPAKATRGRRIGRWLLFLVIAAVGAVLAGAWRVGARRSGELEMSISLPRERFLQGVSIPMELRIRNATEHGVEVDRFAPHEEERCVSLYGKPIELVLYYEDLPEPSMRLLPEPGDEGPGILEPDESLQLDCNVAQLFGLMKPGLYTLEVRYVRDRWAHDPSLAWAARLFASVVHPEEPVQFRILSRFYDTQNQKVNELGNSIGAGPGDP